MDDLADKLRDDFPILPHYGDDFRGQRLNESTLAVLKHRSKLSYLNGFWYGYALALGVSKENE